jgi:hypothetical protein
MTRGSTTGTAGTPEAEPPAQGVTLSIPTHMAVPSHALVLRAGPSPRGHAATVRSSFRTVRQSVAGAEVVVLRTAARPAAEPLASKGSLQIHCLRVYNLSIMRVAILAGPLHCATMTNVGRRNHRRTSHECC